MGPLCETGSPTDTTPAPRMLAADRLKAQPRKITSISRSFPRSWFNKPMLICHFPLSFDATKEDTMLPYVCWAARSRQVGRDARISVHCCHCPADSHTLDSVFAIMRLGGQTSEVWSNTRRRSLACLLWRLQMFMCWIASLHALGSCLQAASADEAATKVDCNPAWNASASNPKASFQRSTLSSADMAAPKLIIVRLNESCCIVRSNPMHSSHKKEKAQALKAAFKHTTLSFKRCKCIFFSVVKAQRPPPAELEAALIAAPQAIAFGDGTMHWHIGEEFQSPLPPVTHVACMQDRAATHNVFPQGEERQPMQHAKSKAPHCRRSICSQTSVPWNQRPVQKYMLLLDLCGKFPSARRLTSTDGST